jgi:leader peptidase (prepilin peptidase) / N-methyltransferase
MNSYFGFIQSEAPWFFPIFVGVIGACIGSFLNVCIYRIPKGESVVWPPSHSSDGRPLKWWENIPVISWLVLRGRDRVTGSPYGARYLIVEVLTAILFVWAWCVHSPAVALVGMMLIAILIVGSFIDLDYMILPDGLTIGGTVIGVVVAMAVPSLQLGDATGSFFIDGLAACVMAVISALIGAGLVFWISELGEAILKKPAMGLGDAKLLGCIGAFLGWKAAVFSLFGGAIIGCVILIPILVFQSLKNKGVDCAPKEIDPDEDESGEEGTPLAIGVEVPFGPMLAMGAVVYFLGASQWIDPYFLLLHEIIFG